MTAPVWMRNTVQTATIALSAVPILLAVPGVILAHDILRRDLNHHATATPAYATAGSTAFVFGAIGKPLAAGR
ncbi:MAG: hypothetical protein U0Y82_06440 [Thermoleophilia bacterium]